MNLIAPLHPEDRAHCHRVAALSRLLAELTGHGGKELQTIYQSAMLHDIGKMAIPLDILHKPEPLTAEERAVIQTHAGIGADMLKRTAPVLPTAAVVARQHHERLDGSGYLGLREKEIHPHARLIAVADVFDALISPRPYKGPWSVPSICAYLDERADIQFDAGVTGTLLSNLDRVLELYRPQKTHKQGNAYFMCLYAH